MTIQALSPRQQQILDFIRKYTGQHNTSPSLAEIAALSGDYQLLCRTSGALEKGLYPRILVLTGAF